MGDGSDAASALQDRSLFQPFLQPVEKVIWRGRPERARWAGLDNWRMMFLALTVVSLVPSGLAGLAVYQLVRQWGWNSLPEHWGPLKALLAFNAPFLPSLSF